MIDQAYWLQRVEQPLSTEQAKIAYALPEAEFRLPRSGLTALAAAVAS